jgi:FkbM family methyltransferase
MVAKQAIQGSLARLGVRLARLQPTAEQRRQLTEAEYRKTLWLRDIGIKTVFDIGANTGQFAHYIRTIFPYATLYCFEPLLDCYQQLANDFQHHKHFQAFNVALGTESGEVEIHRSSYSPSSSLLPMTDLHKENFPHTRDSVTEKVRLAKLDDLANDLHITRPMLLKVDVQGFEQQVLVGGPNVISQADVIIIELSFEPLYEGQSLFNDLYQMLVRMGFQYRGNQDQLISAKDGRVLQADGIFVRV